MKYGRLPTFCTCTFCTNSSHFDLPSSSSLLTTTVEISFSVASASEPRSKLKHRLNRSLIFTGQRLTLTLTIAIVLTTTFTPRNPPLSTPNQRRGRRRFHLPVAAIIPETSPETKMPQLLNLPTEILGKIVTQAHPDSLAALRLSCRALYKCCL